MATLYISEYGQTKRIEGRESAQIADEASLTAEQTVAIGGASAQCANAFNAGTEIVRVHTDAVCSIAFGANPTATTSNKRIDAGQTEYFGVRPGWKIAVISNT